MLKFMSNQISDAAALRTLLSLRFEAPSEEQCEEFQIGDDEREVSIAQDDEGRFWILASCPLQYSSNQLNLEVVGYEDDAMVSLYCGTIAALSGMAGSPQPRKR